MTQLLHTREAIIKFFKRRESLYLFLIKFLAGLIVVSVVNGIGGYSDSFKPLFEGVSGFMFKLLLAALSTVASPMFVCAMAAALVVLQLSSALMLMVFAGLALALIVVLYCRADPERCLLILALVICWRFGLHYLVVILAGLYYGLPSIIPVTLGVFINGLTPACAEILKNFSASGELDFTELPVLLADTYTALINGAGADLSWVFIAFVFVMVIVAVHSISKLSIDYSPEIAIIAGAFVNLIGFICAAALSGAGGGILSAFVMNLICSVFAVLFRFFDIALDYDRTERVQFEDDDYFYHVKIVPKHKLSFDQAEEALVERKRAARPEAGMAVSKRAEAGDVSGRRPIETRTDSVRRPIETRTDSVRRPIETRTDSVRRPIETRTDSVRRPIETRTDSGRRPIETRTDSGRRPIETRTASGAKRAGRRIGPLTEDDED